MRLARRRPVRTKEKISSCPDDLDEDLLPRHMHAGVTACLAASRFPPRSSALRGRCAGNCARRKHPGSHAGSVPLRLAVILYAPILLLPSLPAQQHTDWWWSTHDDEVMLSAYPNYHLQAPRSRRVYLTPCSLFMQHREAEQQRGRATQHGLIDSHRHGQARSQAPFLQLDSKVHLVLSRCRCTLRELGQQNPCRARRPMLVAGARPLFLIRSH